MKELKAEAAKTLEHWHSLNRRIRALEEKRKLTCKHERTKIVNQSYKEEGRMSHAIEWNEEVCCKCKAVLAQSNSTSVEKWSRTDAGKNATLKSIPKKSEK